MKTSHAPSLFHLLWKLSNGRSTKIHNFWAKQQHTGISYFVSVHTDGGGKRKTHTSLKGEVALSDNSCRARVKNTRLKTIAHVAIIQFVSVRLCTGLDNITPFVRLVRLFLGGESIFSPFSDRQKTARRVSPLLGSATSTPNERLCAVFMNPRLQQSKGFYRAKATFRVHFFALKWQMECN